MSKTMMLPGDIVHMIPVDQKHTLSVKCKCGPTIDGRIVKHRPGRGYRGLWRVKFQKGKLR